MHYPKFISTGDRRISRAITFAEEKHRGQKRKYPDVPGGELAEYFTHPQGVAFQLMEWKFNDSADCIILGLLHDVLEMTNTTVNEVAEEFGHELTAKLVQITLVKHPGMKRKIVQFAYNMQLRVAHDDVKIVKLADIFNNLSGFEVMAREDPKFAAIYLKEKSLQVSLMQPPGIAFEAAQQTLDLIKYNEELHL